MFIFHIAQDHHDYMSKDDVGNGCVGVEVGAIVGVGITVGISDSPPFVLSWTSFIALFTFSSICFFASSFCLSISTGTSVSI